jgi:hypothetical protein
LLVKVEQLELGKTGLELRVAFLKWHGTKNKLFY